MKAVIVKDISDAIRIGYSGKALGTVQASAGGQAKANFEKFLSYFRGKKVYDMPAVGGHKIIEVDALGPAEVDASEADVLITRSLSALLTLRAADCIPLVFYMLNEPILALAHVGTSGAKAHLPRKVIDKLGVKPDKLQVYVGPHVSQKSYRFTESIDKKELDESWQKYVSQETDGTHIDLLGFVLDELAAAGVRRENIQLSEVDTGADQNYFSHRRHKLTGEPDGRNAFGVCLL